MRPLALELRALVLVLLLVLLLVATPCAAAPLYMLGNDGAANAIYQLSQETGKATVVVPLPGQNWGGLGHRPGDDAGVYVTKATGNTFERSTLNRVDLNTGAIDEVLSISPSDLGVQSLLLSTVVIDPAAPDHAIAGVNATSATGFIHGIVHIDLASGVVGPIIELVYPPSYPNDDPLTALTYTLDGSTLYGASATWFGRRGNGLPT
jgi:hypothetical protein